MGGSFGLFWDSSHSREVYTFVLALWKHGLLPLLGDISIILYASFRKLKWGVCCGKNGPLSASGGPLQLASVYCSF